MTTTNLLTAFVFSLLPLLTCGCTADDQAREFAGRLNKLTLTYESEVSAKAEAEQKFYSEQLNNLSYVVSGRAAGDPDANSAPNPIDDSFKVTNTVAYGLIVTNANSDAVRLAESLTAGADRPQIKTAMMKFLTDGIESDTAAYLTAQQRREQLQSELLKELEVFDLHAKDLKSLRDDLESLERNPDPAARAKELAPLVEAVRAQLKKSAGASATSGQGN